jgi:hypothetical protein
LLGDGDDLDIQVLDPIGPRFFDDCPICGAPATHREHVPPESLGGKTLTRTCEPCNVRLGSLVEPALSQWFHVELPSARFRSAGFHGARSAGHVLIRSTTDGRAVPFLDGRHHSDVDAMLAANGPVLLEGLLPDANLCWLALLKHSYLSFCLKYGPPTGYIADLIRRDLIAARTPTRDAVHASVLSPRLTVGRGQPISDVPPVSEAIAYDTAGRAHNGALLVGSLFVSWTFDMQSDHTPARDRQVRAYFTLGTGASRGISSIG